MPGHDIIVVGASAGGVEALTTLARGLPPDLPAAVFVVLHLPADVDSLLPGILTRAGKLPARHYADKTPIEHGRIYVAPPNYHLLVTDSQIRLSRGPREHGTRPAVDPLFRSAANAYGPRVVAVVLSGTLYDGALGAAVVKAHGGLVVVQDPDEATYSGMPESAIASARVDYTVSIQDMPALLDRLAREEVSVAGAHGRTPNPAKGAEEMRGRLPRKNTGAEDMADNLEHPEDQIEQDIRGFELGERRNGNSVLTCPECGGVLWEFSNGDLLEYRCHVGHAYSHESLKSEQDEALEMALWSALRALAEKAVLSRRLAESSREAGRHRSAQRFEGMANEAAEATALLRKMLLDGRDAPIDEEQIDY